MTHGSLRARPAPRRAAGARQRIWLACRDTRGGSAMEYVILVGLVGLLAIAGITRFGSAVTETAERQAACLEALDAAGCQGHASEDLAADGKAAAPAEAAPPSPLDEPGVFASLQQGLRLGSGADGKLCVGDACVGGNCFVAGTTVATPDGGRAIETLRAGDLVSSVDPATGALVARPVTRTFVTRRREVLRVRIGEGPRAEEVGVTAAHRFWVDGHGWTEAADLGAGVQGVTQGGATLALAALPGEAAEATVYNLEVEGTHTYFVGESRALVHNDCIEDAKAGELHDPKRRAAIEKLAEWGPYNDETYLMMANAVFGERHAKDAFKKTKWDLHQAKQIPFDAYWFHDRETEKANWFPNSWKALRQGLFEGNPAATRAVQQIIAAAEQTGVDPDWGGERLREAKRLIAKNTPPVGTGGTTYQKFILPEIPKEVRDDLNIDLQLGIADWWSRLDDGQRNSVNDALRELKEDKRKQRKLLVELASDEIAKKVGSQPPAKYDDWIDRLPPPVANGMRDMSELKRAVMGHAWDRLDRRDFEAISSELLGLLDRGASNKAVATTLYNRLVPPNVSTSRLLRYEISVRDGEMSVPAYTELLARQIPAMAKKEQTEAAAEEASRKADLIARMQKIMGDPGLAKRGQRDAKTLEVYGRSDAARLGHTALGFGKQGVDTVVGIGEMVVHPIQTAQGLWFAVTNPDKSVPALLVSLDESYHDDPDQFLGRVTFEITLAAATAGGGEAVSAADKARKMARLAKEAHAAGDLMKAIKYAQAAEDLARKAEKVAQTGKATAETARVASEARAAATSADLVAGAAKTELVTRAQRVLTLAEEAFPRYAKELEPAKKAVSDALGTFGDVQARAKDPVSAANRLERAIDRFGKTVDKLDDVLPNLWDAIGTRVVLKDAANIDGVVDALAKAIKSGDLVITELNNLHGPGGTPYFSPQQLERLQQAAAAAGKPLRINQSKLMDSGYTVVTAYTHHAGGVRGELQIIGKKVLELADLEHIPYDLSLGKPLVRAIPPDAVADMQRIVKPIEEVVRTWDKAKWEAYNGYLNEAYKHARNQELGIPSKPPKLPDGFPESVSVDGLKRLHHEMGELKARVGSGATSGLSPKARLESALPPAGALMPTAGMPKVIATALTKSEAAEAARYADDLGRIAANIDKNPLGTAKELSDLKWGDKVKVSWDKPIEMGESQFTRLGDEAKRLAKEADVPEQAALEYLIDEKFNNMLSVQQAWYHDPRTGVTHVPRDFIVYKDGVNRPLNLANPIEKAWAERHARVLVEEFAHGAGSAVRPGQYTPLTPRLVEFQKWLGDAKNKPWLDANFTADELAAMGGHWHEADITALLHGRSPHGSAELGRYKIREAYEEFAKQSAARTPPPGK